MSEERPIAVLVSQYPTTSHTFIRREVEALRRRGLTIATMSVRPAEANLAGAAEAEEAARTFYVLPPRLFALAKAHLRQFFRRPIAYLRTLFEATRHRVPGASALLWSFFHFAEAVLVADELERISAKHLHTHFANAGATVGYLASRLLGLGWSLTLHGTSDLDYPSGFLLPPKIAAARFVACVSHFGRAQAMRRTDPRHWPKIVLVRCGVTTDRLPAKRARAAGEPLRFLTVGRLSPEKGQLGLVDAFAAALGRGLDATLSIAGDGPSHDALAARIAERGVAERVRLLGRLTESQVLDAVAGSEVFVLSSFMEGLPVVLMEALVVGVPVIAPSVAGVPELVEHGVTGLLFPAGDFDTLAERLLALGSDPALRDRLAEAGRARALAQHDIDRAVAPLAEVLTASDLA